MFAHIGFVEYESNVNRIIKKWVYILLKNRKSMKIERNDLLELSFGRVRLR